MRIKGNEKKTTTPTTTSITTKPFAGRDFYEYSKIKNSNLDKIQSAEALTQRRPQSNQNYSCDQIVS